MVFEELIVFCKVKSLKNAKKRKGNRHNWMKLTSKLMNLLREFHEKVKICKNIEIIAVNFDIKRLLRRYFVGFKVIFRRKQSKIAQEKEALRMRNRDLVESALRRIIKVGFYWRNERLSLTSQARLHKDQRIWRIVAKCASIWRQKTLSSRKMPLVGVQLEVKRETTEVVPRTLPRIVSEERKETRRPPPRRLNSGTPTQSVPVSIPKLTPTKPASHRLLEIEAELLEYKIEKSRLQSLSKDTSTPPSVLHSLRTQYEQRLPRIHELFSELAQLRSLISES